MSVDDAKRVIEELGAALSSGSVADASALFLDS